MIEDFKHSENTNKPPLHTGETHLDVAKDKGLQNSPYFLQGDEDNIYSHEGKGSGSVFQNHEKRRPDFGAYEFMSDGKRNYSSGRRFAINSRAEAQLKNKIVEGRIQEYFLNDGMDGAEYYLAEGFTPPHRASMGDRGRVSNESIKKDNYEFVLRNTHLLKANVAKTLLAKMDIDRDVVGTLSDMLNAESKWGNTDPEVVIRELKNRLRQNSKEEHASYAPIFKILDKISDIERKNEAYKAIRLKALEENITTLVEDMGEQVYGFTHENKEQRERVGEWMEQSFGEENIAALRDDITYKEYLHRMLEKDPNNDALYSMHTYIQNENPLLGNKSSFALYEDSNKIEDMRFDFTNTHNLSTTNATNIMNRLGYHSKHLPIPLLASFTDRELASKNFSEPLDDDDWTFSEPLDVELKDVELKRSIKDVVKGLKEEEVSSIVEDMKKHLSENKSDFEYLYNPEVDTVDPHRKNQLFELNSHNDQDAQNIMRDALYLAMFKHQNQEMWDEVYQGKSQVQEEIVTSSLDKEALKVRPKMDEVNDLYNGILLVTKSSSASMSDTAVDKLSRSKIFEESSVFTPEDISGLKHYSKSLSRESERLKEKEIYGVPEDKELHSAIQEMRYMDAANKEIAKAYGGGKGGIKNQIVSTFFANNKIIHDLSVCMEGAKAPTNHVETVPSMTKACLEKMKQDHEKMKEEMDRLINSREAGMIGATPFGILLIIASIKSSTNAYRADEIIENVNKIVAEDLAYVDSANSSLVKAARKMNIDVDNLGIGGHIVKDGFQNKFIDAAESEHTIRDIVLSSGDNKLDKPFVLNSLFKAEQSEALSSIENVSILTNDKKSQADELKAEIATLQQAEKEFFARQDRGKELNTSLASLEKELNKAEKENDIEKVKLLKDEGQALKDELVEMSASLDSADIAKINNIKAVLQTKSNQLAGLEANMTGGSNDASLAAQVKTLFSSNSGFTTLSLQGRSPSVRLGLIQFLGAYRDTLNKRILHAPDDSESKNIEKELKKLDQVLPQLHREAIYDKDVYSRTLNEFIKDEYQIGGKKDAINKIKEEGLSDRVISEIMNDVRDRDVLTDQKERALFFDLKEAQKARRLLNPENGEMHSFKGSGTITRYLNQFNRFNNDTGRIISDSNDFHASVSQSSNGNYYVVGAKGKIGFYLKESERLDKAGDYEQLVNLNKRAAHLDIQGKIDNDAVSAHLDKISYEGNSITQANAKLLQKTMLSNRAAREKRQNQERQEGKNAPSPG